MMTSSDTSESNQLFAGQTIGIRDIGLGRISQFRIGCRLLDVPSYTHHVHRTRTTTTPCTVLLRWLGSQLQV